MHYYLAQTAATGRLGTDLWEGLRHDWRALTWLGLLQVAWILAAWLAARYLVPRREMNSYGQYDRREGAGLGKAILLYLAYLTLAIVCVLVFKAAGHDAQHALVLFGTAPSQLGVKWIAIFTLAALLGVFVKFALPMLIFRVRLARAVGLLLVIGLLTAGAGWALDFPLGHPARQRIEMVRAWSAERHGQPAKKSTTVQAKEEVAFALAESIAADTAKPMADRKEAVRGLYTQLEHIRTTLPAGDTEALAEYDRKVARYKAAMKQITEEIAAHPELAP